MNQSKHPLKFSGNLGAVALAILIVGMPSFAQATCLSSITVTNNGDGGTGSLRQAVADVCDGGTIDFGPALSGQTIVLTSGELLVAANLTVKGPGAGQLTISGNNSARVFNIASGNFNVSLSGVTIANGKATNSTGGGLLTLSSGTVSIDSCAISNNSASDGSMYSSGAVTPGITAGGICCAGGKTIIANSTISHNSATDSLVRGGAGGGIAVAEAALEMSNCVISNNAASTTSGGKAGGGGVMGRASSSSGGSLTISNSAVTSNSASVSGTAGPFTATESAGGILGIGSNGLLTINQTEISKNSLLTGTNPTVTVGAGGVSARGPDLNNCNVSDNTAVVANLPTGSEVGGGACIRTSSRGARVVNSTFSGNSVLAESSTLDGIGGGAFDSAGSDYINSTFSGNSAGAKNSAVGGIGGGMFTYAITNSVASCTFSGNSASSTASADLLGGGICNVSSSNPAKTVSNNTIVAGNSATTINGQDVAGPFTSRGYNLIGTADGSTSGFVNGTNGDQVGTNASRIDPKLSQLGDNGGPTRTMALQPGSPAIDKGIRAATYVLSSTTDQRGLPRPSDDPAIPNAIGGDGSDIGAFEVQVTPLPGAAIEISTRLSVGTGDNTLIVGFIVDGDVPKKMLIRGIGTSLKPFFGDLALADPTLTLRNQATGELLGTNDDWKTTQIGGVITSDQSAEIQASGSAPSQDAESAILATLPKGQYTAEVKGAGGGTGFALAEIYDRETSSPAKLANLSTRGQVGVDDNIMISGLFLANQPTTIVVRALGPTLGDVGVPNAMVDPTLDIVNADGTTAASNDNWQDAANHNEIPASLQPAHPSESVILTTLAPGRYTVQLRGKDRSTGNALIEAYVLK